MTNTQVNGIELNCVVYVVRGNRIIAKGRTCLLLGVSVIAITLETGAFVQSLKHFEPFKTMGLKRAFIYYDCKTGEYSNFRADQQDTRLNQILSETKIVKPVGFPINLDNDEPVLINPKQLELFNS